MGCVSTQNKAPINENLQARSSERRQSFKKELNYNLTTSCEDLRDFYSINPEIIGTGQYSHIRLGQHKVTKLAVAIKTINKNCHEYDKDQFMEELVVMQNLDHPNIVKFYEVFEDKF
jgi:calcium-dependent protein kinase